MQAAVQWSAKLGLLAAVDLGKHREILELSLDIPQHSLQFFEAYVLAKLVCACVSQLRDFYQARRILKGAFALQPLNPTPEPLQRWVSWKSGVQITCQALIEQRDRVNHEARRHHRGALQLHGSQQWRTIKPGIEPRRENRIYIRVQFLQGIRDLSIHAQSRH